MAVQFVDRIGPTPVLTVQYDPGETTITLNFCPADVLAKGPEFPAVCGGVLFRVTALGAGNVVWSVTRDTRTADTTIVVGTPVYVWFSGWQLEEEIDRLETETATLEEALRPAQRLFMAQNFV